jgi:hypothetical protein
MNKIYCVVLSLIFGVFSIQASEPEIWSVNSRADVLKGDARGVSIDDNGVITLAPKLSESYKTEQPFVWSSATDAAGNIYLGTGGDGKIFKVDASGKGSLFADLAELNVSALAIGGRGEIFAATLPDGKVYQISASGTPSIYFDPQEKYIWSLAVLPDGSLAVGTGENGKLYKVRAANAAPEASLLFDTSETHIISLAADRQGNLFAGTDSNGLVLKFGADGKPFGVLDSPLREIHELTVGPDGSVYALALGESVSTPKPAETTTTTATTDGKTVTVEKPSATTETPAKSRYDLTASKSAVYRILPDGGSDIIWNSPTVSAFAIYAHQTGNGVMIGTSDKGRIYSVTNEGRETLVQQTDEGQISTIKVSGQKLIVTSSNQGKLYNLGGGLNPEGTYESAVLDAKAVSSWGRIWWASTGDVQLQTRSGNTEKPNETWSAWSAVKGDAKGAQIDSPKSKYIQWRATLRNAASLNEVSVSFLPRNIAPEVLTIQVLPTNIGLAANPPVQLDPNIELSGLDPVLFGVVVPPSSARRVYQRGAKSLQWTAEDRNGDKLVYDVYYKETKDANFKLLKENLPDTFFTIDGQSLTDGRYIFRIVAKDSISNPAGQSLSGEKLSEPFDIDNTAPTVSAVGAPAVAGDRARVTFEAAETSSYLNRAEFSVNGGEWREVYADDGISDGQRERYTIEIPVQSAGEYSVTLRVFDANGNPGNAKIVVRK